MINEKKFLSRPVYSLQSMLREISFHAPAIKPVVPNGIFGEDTLEAVMLFQREFHPPVTGVVDLETWDAIVDMYQTVLFFHGPPPVLHMWPRSGVKVNPKKQTPQVYVMQGMYTALADVIDNIKPTALSGIFDDMTQANTKVVQRLSRLPETGRIDRATADALNRMYHTFLSPTKE